MKSSDLPKLHVAVVVQDVRVLLELLKVKDIDTVFVAAGDFEYHPFFLKYHRMIQTRMDLPELRTTLVKFSLNVLEKTKQELLLGVLQDKVEAEVKTYEVFFYSSHPAVGRTVIVKQRKPKIEDLKGLCRSRINK